MTLALPGAPFPVTYRELWLPPGIKNWDGPLPPSVEGGHGLPFTGARHGTTADGVRFTGAADSNINCGAIHNGATKLYVSFRFKLDRGFSDASPADIHLWGKDPDAANFIGIRLRAAGGQLQFIKYTIGAPDFIISTVETSWNAGQWYHVICSISDTEAARLRIDNGVAATDVDVTAGPVAGDLVFGDFNDPGAGTGFEGVIVDFFCEEGLDLTDAQETDLFNGIPPATVDNAYPLDEGRGVIAYDRGTGGNNGTLDTTATWAFGQVQQPVLSLDGINDVATSGAGVDISGALTVATVIKAKSTYDGLAADHYLAHLFIDANNELRIYYDNAADVLRFHAEGVGTAQTVDYATKPVIDDYMILLLTLTGGNVLNGYVNGSLVGTAAGVGIIAAGAAIAHIGAEQTPSLYDISKPLMVALIDGAFTQAEARTYSRYLRNIFNLPITI